VICLELSVDANPRYSAYSLDTDNLELLILSALAENYASEPRDSRKETTTSVIVEGLPGTTASTTEDVELWVSMLEAQFEGIYSP
jgi:hypothetical protein